ncbi:MAG: ATP synthase F1 subunit gamma [Bacilli bacterium]
MSSSLIETKKRIATINSTTKITKAMKLVASVKFKRWKDFYNENLSYADAMKNTVIKTLRSVDFNNTKVKMPDCLKVYSETKNLYIVVTSTLGLCAGYNYNMYKLLDKTITEEDEIIVIGEKGYIHYKNNFKNLNSDFVNLLNNFSYDEVKRLRHFIIKLYRTRTYASINLVYTKYLNSLTFVPEILRIIPLDYDINQNVAKVNYEAILEPSPNEVLKLIIPHYVDSLLYSKMMETALAEFASRRNAMENATNNADELLDKLRIEYNKKRQAGITEEIIEVVSGAAANNN